MPLFVAVFVALFLASVDGSLTQEVNHVPTPRRPDQGAAAGLQGIQRFT